MKIKSPLLLTVVILIFSLVFATASFAEESGEDVAPNGEINLEKEGIEPDDLEFVRKAGIVTNVDDSSITIEELTCAITDETAIRGDIVEAAKAHLLGVLDAEGSCTAMAIAVRDPSTETTDSPSEFDHTAHVKRLSETTIKVGRLTFAIDEDTEISDDIALHDKVYVQATRISRGEFKANVVTLIEQTDPEDDADAPMIVMGFASDVTDTSVVVEDVTFQINEETNIKGDLVDGAKVSIKAIAAEDATLVAVRIVASKSQVEEEASTFLRGEASDVTDTSVTIDEDTVAITADTEINGDLIDGAKIFVKAEADENDALTASIIYVKRNAPTIETDTKSLAGKVTSLTDTDLSIRNKTFAITENSEMPDELAEGDRVRLTAQIADDGTYEVLLVEALNEALGRVEAISDTGIRMNSVWYKFDEACKFDGDITVGDTVSISTEVDKSDALFSPMMRAATTETAEETAVLISPTTLAPTSIGLADSGTAGNISLMPILLAMLAMVSLLTGGLFIWKKQS